MNGNRLGEMEYGNLVEMWNQWCQPSLLWGKIQSRSRIPCRGTHQWVKNPWMCCPLRLTLIKWLVSLTFTRLLYAFALSGWLKKDELLLIHSCYYLQPTNGSLSMLVRAVLLDKKPEEVPMVIYSPLLNWWT